MHSQPKIIDLSPQGLAQPLDRRSFTRAFATTLGLGAVAAACGGSDGEGATKGQGSGGAVDPDADTSADTASAQDTLVDADVPWATGGTAAMAGGYPNPFTATPEACALTCALTLGPCYVESVVREDISEGNPGLPMRLLFRVVDVDCVAVEGAEVDVWHTDLGGRYSGAEAADMCTGGDAAARAGRWFRGVQTTDSDGVAGFNSCLPGWYPSRAVHIHLQVRVAGRGMVTTQVFFADALLADVYTHQPDYAAFGMPRVSTADDGILADADPAMLQLSTARQPDGALLAYKTIVLRRSLDEEGCAV